MRLDIQLVRTSKIEALVAAERSRRDAVDSIDASGSNHAVLPRLARLRGARWEEEKSRDSESHAFPVDIS